MLYCFGNGIEFSSHWPEEVIPESYDKCEPCRFNDSLFLNDPDAWYLATGFSPAVY